MAEATMICVDSSDWMRNSDFSPTRLESQRDAIQLLAGRKLNGHPESCVGLMTMAGSREVLATLTNDIGKIFAMLHNINIDGNIDFVSSLKVAKLALKFRQQKNHRQRVIVFVGSPIQATAQELTQLGKKFQKDNVSVDVINFGEEEANQEKLEAFIKAVDKNDNSHLVTVPSGVRVLSDVLIKSPILSSGDDDNGMGGGGGGSDFVDPNLDPELALVLRVSMEEERERQRKAQLEAGGDGDGAAAQQDNGAAPMDTADDMDPELRAAMQMSMQGMAGGEGASTEDSSAPQAMQVEEKSLDQMTEEEQIEYAIRMSTLAAASEEKEEKKEEGTAAAQLDPSLLSEVMSEIPGVDPNDERLLKAMEELQKSEEKKDGEGK